MFWLEDPGVTSINSKYFLNQLGIDQAFLTVIYKFREAAENQQYKKLWIYSLSSNCHRCPYQREGEVSDFIHSSPTLRERTLKINTKYPLKFRLRTNGNSFLVPHNIKDEEAFCDVEPIHLGEFGVYEITANVDEGQYDVDQMSLGSVGKCEFREIHPPVNIFYPLLLAVIFFGLFLFLSLRIFKYLETSKRVKNSSPRKRLDFIDIFRGICIFLMILVNGGGGGYTFLQHANWDGLNVADVIFPWFLWLMGVSIPISYQFQSLKETSNRKQKIWATFRRSCKLVAVGIFMNLSFMCIRTTLDLTKLRLLGVLQRYGVCYFIASTLLMFGSSRSRTRFGWSFVLFLLAIHTCLTFFLPVPGCPTGYLGPGGLHENAKYSPKCIGGSAGFIDRLILSENHMTHFSTAHSVYHTGGVSQPFDPEGIFSTLTSLLHVWLGVQAGFFFLDLSSKVKKNSRAKFYTVCSTFASGLAVGLGLLLHNLNWIPINKKLWSISLVLVTSGTAWILLLFLYYVTEVKGLWRGSPFREMGLNPILFYKGHSLFLGMNLFPFYWTIERMTTHTTWLIQTFWGLGLWILLALVCHHKRIYWVLR